MPRLWFAALSAFGVGALSEARACTTLESPFKPGSPEAIAEQLLWKKELARGIVGDELIFVGKVISERLPDLSEISSALNGEFNKPDNSWIEIPGVRSWFAPIRVIKGSPDFPTTNIFSGMYDSTCGYGPRLKLGTEVVVFANKRNGFWFGATTTPGILPLLEPLLR